jgi:hypothetical protein
MTSTPYESVMGLTPTASSGSIASASASSNASPAGQNRSLAGRRVSIKEVKDENGKVLAVTVTANQRTLVTSCPHTDREHRAKGKCSACYRRMRRALKTERRKAKDDTKASAAAPDGFESQQGAPPPPPPPPASSSQTQQQQQQQQQ